MNYFDNKAIVDKTFNGKAFGSNAVALPDDAYVDLDIEHQLGSELFNSTVIGNNLTISDLGGGSYKAECDGSASDNSSSASIVFSDTVTHSDSMILLFSFDATSIVIDGWIITGYYDGTSVISLDTPHTVVLGHNEVKIRNRINTNMVGQLYCNGSIPFEVDIANISIKEITTNNSYLTYTDPVTQDIVDVTLPAATTYKMENDFSNAVSHDTPFSQADLDLMKADPLTLMRVFFDGLVLPSGFAKVNMKHYYPGNCGVNGERFVQDICVDLGVNACTDIYVAGSLTLDGDKLSSPGGGTTYGGGLNFATTSLPTDGYVYISFKVNNLVGIPYVSGFHDGTTIFYFGSQKEIRDGYVSFICENRTNTRVQLYLDDQTIWSFDITEYEVRDATAAEIQNYTDACRTTYLNTNKGMSNLLIEQDASGRPTATLPNNTVDYVNSNGANVNTGFKPSLPKMTIKEVVSGNLADLDSNGNPLGTFSERTEHRAIKIWEEEGEPNSWEWETTTANETMEIPVKSTNTYDMTIEWGDGDSETYTGDGSVKPSHVYVNAGSYEVVLTGICPQLYFNGTTEVSKLTKILGLGETGLITCYGMYRNASNLQDCTFGLCDTSNVTSMRLMMYNWTSMTTTPDLSSFDTSKVTTMYAMMYNWTSMTTAPDLSSFDTSKVTDMDYMMYGWSSMGEIGNIGIENFNISSLTTASLMLKGTTVSTATMDLILVNWEAQSHKSNVTVHFGEGNYTLGGAAETAYNNLVADGWSINGITGI